MIGVNGLLLSGVFKQLISGQKSGGNAMSDMGSLLIIVFTTLFTILFINIRLETQISEEGIYVKFFPVHLSFRLYTWENITKSFVRQYDPIREYGGWGLRFGLSGTRKAFNVSGDKGLQLEFADHKKLLIGTNKPDEITETLKRIGQLKP